MPLLKGCILAAKGHFLKVDVRKQYILCPVLDNELIIIAGIRHVYFRGIGRLIPTSTPKAFCVLVRNSL